MFSRLTEDCDLLWVAHGGMVVALQVVEGVILSSGKELHMEEVGKVKLWGRDTGRYLIPFQHDLKYEDAFSYLFVNHGYLLAMGIEKDVWIWKMEGAEGRTKCP